MGIHIIKMPDIGEGIAEVELVAWYVKAGDEVKEDQILADVMTDKATVEVPSPVTGKVVSLGGTVGQVMAVGTELIRLEVAGEGNFQSGETPRSPAAAVNSTSLVNAAAAGNKGKPDEAAKAPPAPPTSATAICSVAAKPAAASASASTIPVPAKVEALAGQPKAAVGLTRPLGERPIASPAVRAYAWELGIDLHYVQGSGPAGRILREDIDAYAVQKQSGHAVMGVGDVRYLRRNDEQAVPVIGLRRKIAQKMQDAKRRIPHFSYVEEIDVTELEALRQQLNARWAKERGKLTLLPFIMRAMILALPRFPQINARYDDDADVVTRYGAVHLGMATQTAGGLMVPVLRHAETQDLWGLAAEVTRLADAARNGKAARDELSGSTITLTSLGPLGGIVSTPVINAPEVAIVGVNRIVERPMIRNGLVVARQLMNLSSSFDHRVVDGMDAAEFIQAVRAYLETPATLFVE